MSCDSGDLLQNVLHVLCDFCAELGVPGEPVDEGAPHDVPGGGEREHEHEYSN